MEILDTKQFELGELYVCSIEKDSIILEFTGIVSNHTPDGKVFNKMHFIVKHHLKYDEYVPDIGDDLNASVEVMQRGILVGEISFRTLTKAEQVLYGTTRETGSNQIDKASEERLENDTSPERITTNPLPLVLEARRLSKIYRLPPFKRST